MARDFDGSFYCEGNKVCFKVVKECQVEGKQCSCDIEYFDENDKTIRIHKCGAYDELNIIDPIKAKNYYEEGVNNGK